MEAEDIAKKLTELNNEILDLKLAAASSKPVDDIVRYLLYFWLTISVVLGIFGWNQLSDIDDKIDIAITKQLPKDSNMYRDYETLIADTKKLHENLLELTKDYEKKVDYLKYADIVDPDLDVYGQLQNIILQSNEQRNLLNEDWRTRAIATLRRFKSVITKTSVDAALVFNAAQVARQLTQPQLAVDLTKTAHEKNPSPPIRALKLSSEVNNTTGDTQFTAYSQLLEMVRNLDVEHSPHIVIGEAWNAAEDTRMYSLLLDAVDDLIRNERQNYVPSCVYSLKARILLRRSLPGDKEAAEQVLQEGYTLFQSESSRSQWNQAFKRDYRIVVAVLNEDRSISDSRQELHELPEFQELMELFQSQGEG